MGDKYTDGDGDEITCRNCDTTAREYFEYISEENPPAHWMVGTVWYCSDECYDECTKDEG